jgi:hypothetical protein
MDGRFGDEALLTRFLQFPFYQGKGVLYARS